ncbi:hypothetical protein CKK34_0473 [Yarrowia sp. E02]|nr:hypothetical protein CKK34_0473 [Yarrowia sp. E02]
MDAYRKEQRAAELKKQNRQKRQQKESRLEGLDPLRVHWRLTQLQQKYQNSGFKKVYIPHHEQKQIARLEQDLADLKRSKGISEDDWKDMLDQQKKRETRFKRFKHGLGEVSDYNSPPQGQQRESVFWDPVFNHRGISPRGFPYISKGVLRKPIDKADGEDVEFSSDDEVVDIPLPSEVPRWKQEEESKEKDAESAGKDVARDVSRESRVPAPKIEAKDVYESGPQVRNLAAEAARFVPRQVQLKRKREEVALDTEKSEELEGTEDSKPEATKSDTAKPSSHPMMEEIEEESSTSIHVERKAEGDQMVEEVEMTGFDEAVVPEAVEEEPVIPETVETEAPEAIPVEIEEAEPVVETVTGHKLVIGGGVETAEESEEESEEDDDALY